MQAYKRPPAHGMTWVAQGFALWKRNPGFFAYLTFGYLLASFSLMSVGPFGLIALTILFPALDLGIINGALTIHEGGKPTPGLLFSGLKTNAGNLILIGVIALAVNLLILLAGAVLFDFSMWDALIQPPPQSTEEGIPAEVLEAILAHRVMTIPLAMATAFAPVLAGWQKLNAVKAMFFSLIACWRNILPIALYLTAALFIILIGPQFVSLLVSMIVPALGQVVSMAFLLIGFSILFAAFLPITLDIFGHDIPGHEVAD